MAKTKRFSKKELLEIFTKNPDKVAALAEPERKLVEFFWVCRTYRILSSNAKIHPGTVGRRLQKIARQIVEKGE